MLTFLFWNLKRNNCLKAIGRLAKAHDIDVLMFAECSLGVADLLEELNSGGHSAQFHYNPGNCERIAIYSKFTTRSITPIFETHWLTIRHLQPPGKLDLLLVATHLPSKLNQSEGSQTLAMTEIAKDIHRMEEKTGHGRTVLVGDLNMNPFEHGIVAASGLHAVMDRRIAGRGQRKVNGKSYPFFYNPMWSLLGDASTGPPGTYYRHESEQVAYFWKMFDQVLLRPAILPIFDNKNLAILETDGVASFLKSNGTPDEKTASDHLPILFRLNC